MQRLCNGYASETTSEYKEGKERRKREKRGRIAKDKEGKGGEERRRTGEPMGRNRKGKEGKVTRMECSGMKRIVRILRQGARPLVLGVQISQVASSTPFLCCSRFSSIAFNFVLVKYQVYSLTSLRPRLSLSASVPVRSYPTRSSLHECLFKVSLVSLVKLSFEHGKDRT